MAQNFLCVLPRFAEAASHIRQRREVVIGLASIGDFRLPDHIRRQVERELTRRNIIWNKEAINSDLMVYRNAAHYLNGSDVKRLQEAVARKSYPAIGVAALMEEEIFTWDELWARYPALGRDSVMPAPLLPAPSPPPIPLPSPPQPEPEPVRRVRALRVVRQQAPAEEEDFSGFVHPAQFPITYLFEEYVKESRKFPRIVAGLESKRMRQAAELTERVAPQDFTVFITGETGTGKELFAHSIHQLSDRNGKPFIALNCASIPDTLIEAEFFGFKRGAFTDAHVDSPGKLELANGGTLFLDEIGDLSSRAQGVILRAIETREVLPIGSRKSVAVDIRIVVATNKDLQLEVRQGRFRLDLFHRLYEFPVDLPPLRARSDVNLLLAYFFSDVCDKIGRDVPMVAPEAWQFLLNYSWPGNVRQLRNAIGRVCTTFPGETLEGRQFGFMNDSGVMTEVDDSSIKMGTMADIERWAIVRTLEHCKGNRQAAARMLDIGPSTLYRKMKEYQIRRSLILGH